MGGAGWDGRSRAGLLGSVACGGGWCVLLPVSYYEEVMRVKTARGLRSESLELGNEGLAAGYPRLGGLGCPRAPWGWRLPTSAGCGTTACFSVTEVLRSPPQEITHRRDCGQGRPRGMIMKRRWGARMSLAVGTFLQPGGGRCPGLLPLPCARGAVVGGGVVPPNRRLRPVPWAQTPVGGGYEAPGRLAPPAQQPPGAARPLAPAVVGGALGAVRGPSALLAARTAPIMQQGAAQARTARAGRAAPAGVGDRGGTGGVRGSRQVDGGWRGLVPRTGRPHHPPVGRRSCRGSGGTTQRPSAPPVRFQCGGGEAKATRSHDTWCIGREV